MITGIYAIQNIQNGKQYIGSSVDCQRRWTFHRNALNRDDHHSTSLQRAWNKYGITGFCWLILEECDREELLEREQYWLDKKRPWASDHRGYNEAVEAKQPPCSSTFSAESRKRMGAGWRGKKRGPMPAAQRAKVSASKKGKKLNYTPESMAERQRKAWKARGVEKFTHAGKTMTLSEWAKHLGVKRGTLYYRLKIAQKPVAEALQ